MKSRRIKKVTMALPVDLVKKAQAQTKQGLTETVLRGLEILVSRRASRNLAALEGTIDLKLNLSEFRRNRKT